MSGKSDLVRRVPTRHGASTAYIGRAMSHLIRADYAGDDVGRQEQPGG